MDITDTKRCEVCSEEVSKYRCPRCSKQTCSVKCVNLHKVKEECNGQRDKTVFVPIKKFTENNLLSDYRFLEDVDRTADNAVRNLKKFPYKIQNRNKFLKRTADRKGVELSFLPNVFTKHKRNSSRTFKESPNTIFWCVNWKFPEADDAEIFERKISDKLTIHNVLKKYLHATESNPIHRQRLKCYISDDINNIAIFMEYDRSIHHNRKYYKLDLFKSIEENLKGKVVIEYPTMHVVMKGEADKYTSKVLEGDSVEECTDKNEHNSNVTNEEVKEYTVEDEHMVEKEYRQTDTSESMDNLKEQVLECKDKVSLNESFEACVENLTEKSEETKKSKECIVRETWEKQSERR
ncbi:box C/D snoRNA protein 1-like [Antedon mediterranea]|uniref:box C/D snoRNA protein 1-like n=1 Tax=Antedon mediterranea TaxID=105859 RepID=UPI003AF5EB74